MIICENELDQNKGLSLTQLILKPRSFFSNFKDGSPKFYIVFLANFLLLYSELVTVTVYNAFVSNNQGIARMALIYAMTCVLGSLLAIFLYGVIWFHLPIKLFGGKADLKTTIYSVGYSMLFPSIFGLVSLGIAFIGYVLSIKLLVVLPFLNFILTWIWFLINTGIAVKKINDFGIFKVLIIVLWPFIIAIILGLVGVVPK